MQTTINAKPEELVQVETKERIFARICQMVDCDGVEVTDNTSVNPSKHKEVRIPFVAYDALEDRIKNSGFLDEAPDFFNDDIKHRILIMRILETFMNQEQTTMDDLIGAVINPMLCMGKSISTFEDNASNELVVMLREIQD